MNPKMTSPKEGRIILRSLLAIMLLKIYSPPPYPLDPNDLRISPDILQEVNLFWASPDPDLLNIREQELKRTLVICTNGLIQY